MQIIIYILVAIVIVAFIAGLLIILKQQKKDIETLEKEKEKAEIDKVNLEDKIQTIQDLETGNHSHDFDSSIDILSELARKK